MQEQDLLKMITDLEKQIEKRKEMIEILKQEPQNNIELVLKTFIQEEKLEKAAKILVKEGPFSHRTQVSVKRLIEDVIFGGIGIGKEPTLKEMAIEVFNKHYRTSHQKTSDIDVLTFDMFSWKEKTFNKTIFEKKKNKLLRMFNSSSFHFRQSNIWYSRHLIYLTYFVLSDWIKIEEFNYELFPIPQENSQLFPYYKEAMRERGGDEHNTIKWHAWNLARSRGSVEADFETHYKAGIADVLAEDIHEVYECGDTEPKKVFRYFSNYWNERFIIMPFDRPDNKQKGYIFTISDKGRKKIEELEKRYDEASYIIASWAFFQPETEKEKEEYKIVQTLIKVVEYIDQFYFPFVDKTQ